MTAQQATEVTGLDIFWSRFGGWKAGRPDRDDVRLRSRNCFSDNCNSVSHDPWHEAEVSPRAVYEMLESRARELWLQAEPGNDPVSLAALTSV